MQELSCITNKTRLLVAKKNECHLATFGSEISGSWDWPLNRFRVGIADSSRPINRIDRIAESQFGRTLILAVFKWQIIVLKGLVWFWYPRI
jgi:hypothetical protein